MLHCSSGVARPSAFLLSAGPVLPRRPSPPRLPLSSAPLFLPSASLVSTSIPPPNRVPLLSSGCRSLAVTPRSRGTIGAGLRTYLPKLDGRSDTAFPFAVSTVLPLPCLCLPLPVHCPVPASPLPSLALPLPFSCLPTAFSCPSTAFSCPSTALPLPLSFPAFQLPFPALPLPNLRNVSLCCRLRMSRMSRMSRFLSCITLSHVSSYHLVTVLLFHRLTVSLPLHVSVSHHMSRMSRMSLISHVSRVSFMCHRLAIPPSRCCAGTPSQRWTCPARPTRPRSTTSTPR